MNKQESSQPKREKSPQKRQYRVHTRKLILSLLFVCIAVFVSILSIELIQQSRLTAAMGIQDSVSKNPSKNTGISPAGRPSFDPSSSFAGHTVVLDAGHGGFDPGTHGVETNVAEMDINLSIALYLQTILEEYDITVIMTRQDKNAVADTKSADMQVRAQFFARDDIDIAVSIHQNWYDDPSIKGPQIFYYNSSMQGFALAQSIQSSMNSYLSVESPRQATAADYLLLRAGNAPAVIVECGFLSNAEEERMLMDDDYQQATALAIGLGILEFLSE